MTRLLAFSSLLAFMACASSAIAGDEGPSVKVPEHKVLDHYVGVWDVAITSQETPFVGGQATAKWILDGGYLQQSGTLRAKDGSAGLKVRTLMTYDPGKKVYRSWTFVSDGSASESEATWDEKAQTMTSVRRKGEGGEVTTTTADFSEAGIEKWKFVHTDKSGKVLGEFSGTNTRKTK